MSEEGGRRMDDGPPSDCRGVMAALRGSERAAPPIEARGRALGVDMLALLLAGLIDRRGVKAGFEGEIEVLGPDRWTALGAVRVEVPSLGRVAVVAEGVVGSGRELGLRWILASGRNRPQLGAHAKYCSLQAYQICVSYVSERVCE